MRLRDIPEIFGVVGVVSYADGPSTPAEEEGMMSNDF
jgi:hypothetical protein